METAEGRNEPETFKTVINEGSLPVYERAAEKTGYGLNVTAKAGEEILVQDREKGVLGTFHKVKVSPGNVEVAINVPLGVETTTPFYNAVKELDQSPK